MKKIITAIATGAMLLPMAAFASVDLTLFGADPVTVLQGQSYSEPGYSANSSVDGDITSLVSVSSVDTSVSGSFTIDYSVTDSALDTATAQRGLIVASGGGTMPYCSGPLAPGWQAGVAGGGCGGTEIVLRAGQSVFKDGVLHECPIWYGPIGCVVK